MASWIVGKNLQQKEEPQEAKLVTERGNRNTRSTRGARKRKASSFWPLVLLVFLFPFLLLVDDLLQKWNVLRFRGLFESLDVGEKIRAVLIGDHLRAIERHLVRPRVADVVDESVRVERRGRQPRPVPRLPGVTMTFPAAIL